MLDKASYDSLSQGKLPTIPNTKYFSEILSEKIKERARKNSIRLNSASLIKVQISPIKVVSISDAKLEGYRTFLRNSYIIKSGDLLTFNAAYEYSGVKPEVIVLEQSIEDSKNIKDVLFFPKSSYQLEVSASISEPKNITCKASTKPRKELPLRYIVDRIRETNSLTQTYPIGLFDDRYKPTSEYPVSGAYNVVLDIPYSWNIQNVVYPTPILNGLGFSNLSVTLLSGFLNYEGRFYKDPSTNNTVRISAKITNWSGYYLKVDNWGLVLSVLYDNNKNVSQANVDVNFPSFYLPHTSEKSYTLDVNLPTWAYGKVSIAHAMRFTDASTGTLKYGGGPFYCFEVFRLRLP